MPFKKQKPKNEERIFYCIYTQDRYILNIFKVYEDGSFDTAEQSLIRLDNAIEDPIEIDINRKEWSITINQEVGIWFADEFSINVFLDELFFALESVLEIPDEERTTSKKRVILDLRKEIEYLYKIQKENENG